MKLGVYFPSPVIGPDPVLVRDYAQGAEGAGFSYIEPFEHVTGAHPSRFENPGFAFRPQNSGTTYTYETPWHEPLTLWAYLAGVTTTLEFIPSVLLLAQRQTVLVAKQVAELDILSSGRFRLAVGIGWNFTEYEALGMDWKTRTARIEEQIQVLRLLWTQELVDFQGEFHTLDRVGINPLPPSGALKILYASSARPVVLDRVARLADGWMPLLIRPETPESGVAALHEQLARHGRSAEGFEIDAKVAVFPDGVTPPAGGMTNPMPWLEQVRLWKDLGASHVCLMPRAETVPEMLALAIEAKRRVAEEIGL